MMLPKLPASRQRIVDFINSDADISEWRDREVRTAALVKTCYAVATANGQIDASSIYALCQLTWITKAPGGVLSHQSHRTVKMPSLYSLLALPAGTPAHDVALALSRRARIPLNQARELVDGETGFANTYTVYRNSLRLWIDAHRATLSRLLRHASALHTDQQGRRLAHVIQRLDPIPSPKNRRFLSPENVLTLVVACLDPRQRFPIANRGNDAAMRSLNLLARSLSDQHDFLTALINPVLFKSSFELDVLMQHKKEGIIDLLPRSLQTPAQHASNATPLSGRALGLKDEADVQAVARSRTSVMKRMHNKMTNRLRALLPCAIKEGTHPSARYDALIENYNGRGRDLLVEAKTSLEIGSIRLAIGQLLDYRRYLPRRHTTDLALLLPSRPSADLIALLDELDIRRLWFTHPSFSSLASSCSLSMKQSAP